MSRHTTEIPDHVKFLFGAFSGVGATIICYPAELMKTRMQIQGSGVRGSRLTTSQMTQLIYKREGLMGFYGGLSASMVRQFLYTGVRMGMFQILIDRFTEDGALPGFSFRAACGVFSGLCSGMASLPADVCMTRMMTDGSVPPEKRRNYKHIFDAIGRIVKEEGPATLYRGLAPTVVRAAVVNLTQLLSYMHVKDLFLTQGIFDDNVYCHIVSSVISSFFVSLTALPVDAAKTRMQNMRVINGVPEYSSLIDTWTKIVTKEGPLALWKGFTPMFFRNAPQYLVMFVIYEQFIMAYKKMSPKSY